MSFLIFIGIVTGLFLIVMFKGSFDEQKRCREYRTYLEQQYGMYPPAKYSIDDLRRIAKRYQYVKKTLHQEEAFAIDEITWNDLEMDRLYARLNVTQSAVGAEYLYSMLHLLQLRPDKLVSLEQCIQFFDRNQAERVRIQEICHELGSMGKYSIYDYIFYLTKAKQENKNSHIVMCVAFLATFPLLLWNASAGVAWLLISACVNVLSYVNTKNRILPYLTGIAYIRRLYFAAEQMKQCKDAGVSKEVQSLYQELDETAKALEPFMRHARFASGMRSASGSPIQLVTDYIRMFTHIDLIQYGLMMQELKKHQEQAIRMLDIVGYLDAVIAIASFRRSCMEWSEPVLDDRKDMLVIEQGIHPLLKDPVANDYAGNRGMLVTGSNASGKSTFLKMVALNAVLAQTIHTVTAKRYEGRLFRVYSSMSLRDSLSFGDSYYMVEIKALKRIMDAIEQDDAPVLCFVDEVLRGTNTVERIAASTQILKKLSQSGVHCFAATHDVELTYLLEKEYDNYHFREEIDGKDIVFSYKMLPGRATTHNAIKLLHQLGFDEEMVCQAQRLAERFMDTNQWLDEERDKSYGC